MYLIEDKLIDKFEQAVFHNKIKSNNEWHE